MRRSQTVTSTSRIIRTTTGGLGQLAVNSHFVDLSGVASQPPSSIPQERHQHLQEQHRHFHARSSSPNSPDAHKYAYPHLKNKTSGGSGNGGNYGGGGNSHHNQQSQHRQQHGGYGNGGNNTRHHQHQQGQQHGGNQQQFVSSSQQRQDMPAVNKQQQATPTTIRTPSGFAPPQSHPQHQTPTASARQLSPPPQPMPLPIFRKTIEESITMCIVSAIDGFIIQHKKRMPQQQQKHHHTPPTPDYDDDSGEMHTTSTHSKSTSNNSSSTTQQQLMSDRIVNHLLSSLDNNTSSTTTTSSPMVARRSIPAAGTPAALSKLVLQTMRNASVAWTEADNVSVAMPLSSAPPTAPKSSWEAASQYYTEALGVMNKIEEKLAMVANNATSSDTISTDSVLALLHHPNCPIRPLTTPPPSPTNSSPPASSSSPLSEESIPVSILREVIMPGVLSEITAGAIPMVVADSWAVSLQMLASLKANNADHLLPVDTAMMLMECVILQPMLAQRVRRYQHLVKNCQKEKNVIATTDDASVMTPKLVIPAADGGGGATATEYKRMKGMVSDMDSGLSMLDVPLPVSKKAKLCWMLLRTVQHQERLLGNNNNNQHPGERGGLGGGGKQLDINVLSEPRTAAAASRVLCSSSTLAGFMSLEHTCALVASTVNRMALTQQQTAHSYKQNQQTSSSASSSSPLEELVYTGVIAALLRCMSGHGGAISFSRKRQQQQHRTAGGNGVGVEDHNPRFSSPSSRHLLSGQDIVDVIMSTPDGDHHQNNNTKTHTPAPSPTNTIIHLQGKAAWKTILHNDVLINTIIAILKKETAMDAVVRGGNISVGTLGALECAELVVDLLTRGILTWEGGEGSSSSTYTGNIKNNKNSQFANSDASEFLDTIRTILLVRKVVPGGGNSSTTTTPSSSPSFNDHQATTMTQAQLTFCHYDTHLPLIRRLERIVARNMITMQMSKRSGVWEEALLLCKDRRQGLLMSSPSAGAAATRENSDTSIAALENEMRARGKTNRGHFELSEDLRHVQTSILVHALGNIVESGGSGVKVMKGDINSGVVLQRLLADAESRLSHYTTSLLLKQQQHSDGASVGNDKDTGETESAIQITPDEALLTFLFGPQWLPVAVRKVVLQNAATRTKQYLLSKRQHPEQKNIGVVNDDKQLMKLVVTRSLREATLKALSHTNTGGFMPIREILQGTSHTPAGTITPCDDDFENPYQPLNVHYEVLLAALQHSFVLQAAPVRSFCAHVLPLPYSNTTTQRTDDDKTAQSVRVEREGELVWRLGIHALRTGPSPSLLKCLQALSLCSRPVSLSSPLQDASSSGSAAADSSTITFIADLIKVQMAHSSHKRSVVPVVYNRSRQLVIDIADAIHHTSSSGGSASSTTTIPWNCWRVALGVCQHLVEQSEAVTNSKHHHQRKPDQLLTSSVHVRPPTPAGDDVLTVMKDRTLGSLSQRVEASRHLSTSKVSTTSTTTPHTPAEQLLLALRKLSLHGGGGRSY